MPVILSAAKDPGSFLWFSDLRTTAEILRCAQDDTSEFLYTFSRRGLNSAARLGGLTYATDLRSMTLGQQRCKSQKSA